MAHIILYGAPQQGASGSPFVAKVQIALAEKGLAYETVDVLPVAMPTPPGITPDLAPRTPLGKIPFARIGDRWLSDSSVIITYLDRLHPTPPLYPSDPWELARALWFEEFIDGGAYPRLFSTIFFERLIAPAIYQRPTDQAKVDKAIAEDMPVIHGYLDREIGSRPYLVGDRFTIADAATTAFFISMALADAAPDAARWPNLVRYLDFQRARPTVAPLMQAPAAGSA